MEKYSNFFTFCHFNTVYTDSKEEATAFSLDFVLPWLRLVWSISLRLLHKRQHSMN